MEPRATEQKNWMLQHRVLDLQAALTTVLRNPWVNGVCQFCGGSESENFHESDCLTNRADALLAPV